ncbi:MAG TPA: diaminopimelate decarboxylase [Treponemataceae bacterium]|nr:diaminopimelate decarboxylase [Treponemataceae bacterium]
MTYKPFPLQKEQLIQIANTYETPFYVYDEKGIRKNAQKLKKAFGILPGFKEYFAVKGCPNPYILKILRDEDFGGDCSSLPEVILCEKAGIRDENIMFTSNVTPAEEYIYANARGAILNLDDITHIDFVNNALKGFPELICFRYNPGPLKEGNAIIGKPEEAKYGLTRDQLFEAYAKAKKLGSTRFGLHTMVASNELGNDYFIETARILYELVVEIKEKLDISLEFINMGGGIGIPYKPGEKPVDYDYIAQGIKKVYDEIIVPVFDKDIRFFMECSRVITGPYGWLVTKAIHKKNIYRNYIGVDATMADLMRPGMYGAYHHVSVCGKDNVTDEKGMLIEGSDAHVYDVVGSLCENSDKFAIQRSLPKIDIGDFVLIHDAGAHGRAMGFNYNAKLRCGELLLRTNGKIIQIRRKENYDDYFATLDFKSLATFSGAKPLVK